MPLPQVGFGRTDGGPYEKWFLVEDLPDCAALQALSRDGYRYVHFCEILDVAPIIAELKARGLEVVELPRSRVWGADRLDGRIRNHAPLRAPRRAS